MKNKNTIIRFVVISIFIILPACKASVNSTSSEETTLETSTISPVTVESTPEHAVDYTTLSEIELASAIAEAVTKVVDATQNATTAITQFAADGDITPNENSEILALMQTSLTAVAHTDELILAYDELYSEISVESINSLASLTEELSAIPTFIKEISGIKVQNVDDIIEINDQFSHVLTSAGLTEKAWAWQQQVLSHIDEREKSYMRIQPQLGHVEHNRVGAFAQAHEFLDAYQDAFKDGKLSPIELGNISQIAANAEASFYNTGDPQLFDFAKRIDILTSWIVRSEWPQVHSGVIELQSLLPARPRP
jgi:hypothetical protein